mmetsp:Transcript_16327/g.28919  ORF Transcript_16327/g.28919 Transcript_16327/m.28919 type:complete len:315 (-) Transcript_16327:61-1005(-)|eukprot:CAMPEP_0184551778 /NCGR_PEP_ID=MMETSP0199_2-20130426/26572_1 /TAXON_ID=1112570 /ORGANISM="Thraustochytrium sp., Strain LLF1b" /LENGTH=314 /DNA_ID=CAMNT_0026947069 /DNA_START=254 /DNA_END=1198 /DNA_ORIENTATION=+
MASSPATLRYLFDLRGYAVIRGAFSAAEIQAANQAVDHHKLDFKERVEPALRNTSATSSRAGDGSSGRQDMGGMLGWEKPHCEPFRNILAHPKLVPVLHDLIGEGYRLDHSPLVIQQSAGAEGFDLHGGPLNAKGKMNPALQYRCENGEIWNSLVAVSVQLTDQPAGAGGFCVVPGSHKSNFVTPPELMRGDCSDEDLLDVVVEPVTKAGDVIIFSEASVHGCLAWKEKTFDRRIALYRFAPGNMAFARGYSEGWPESFLEGMTEAQQAVMLPPFNSYLERPCLSDEDATVGKRNTRSKEKKEFDREVFGAAFY